MIAIAEDALHHTLDRASFVESIINVIYGDGLGQWSGSQLMLFNKYSIYEEPSDSTI